MLSKSLAPPLIWEGSPAYRLAGSRLLWMNCPRSQLARLRWVLSPSLLSWALQAALQFTHKHSHINVSLPHTWLFHQPLLEPASKRTPCRGTPEHISEFWNQREYGPTRHFNKGRLIPHLWLSSITRPTESKSSFTKRWE